MTDEITLVPNVDTSCLSDLIWDLNECPTIDDCHDDGSYDLLDGDWVCVDLQLMVSVLDQGDYDWDGNEWAVQDVLKLYNNLVSVSPVFDKIFEFTSWDRNRTSEDVLLGKLKVSSWEAQDLLREAGYDVELPLE